MKDKNFRIMIICTAILLLSFVGTASATNWSVDDDGEADFTRIQDAINNASAGDTILVYSGVYYENVVVDKSVTLKGVGQPVVDAGGDRSAIALSADRITIVGFTVTNSGSSWSDAGIKVTSNNNIITDNNAISNNWGGIGIWNSSNNIITDNNASDNWGGIRIWNSNNNIITDNNASDNWGGIGIRNSNNNIITDNNVISNNGDGISISSSSGNNITA